MKYHDHEEIILIILFIQFHSNQSPSWLVNKVAESWETPSWTVSTKQNLKINKTGSGVNLSANFLQQGYIPQDSSNNTIT